MEKKINNDLAIVASQYLEGRFMTKNLTYFGKSKLLSQRQAKWSEHLSQFNMAIQFWSGHLEAKPDALTQRWNMHPKVKDKDFLEAKPQNHHPIFSMKQLPIAAKVMHLDDETSN